MAIVIGSGDNAYTYNPSNPSDTSIPAPDKSDSGSKSSNQGSGDKKQTFKSKFVYGGSKGVDESVDKKNYDNPSKHKLRNQFDYLTDKYYGGDQEAFAKTSQGQVLLGYLQNVDATRGGGRGADVDTLKKIEQAYQAGEISEEDYKTITQAVGGGIEAIRNLPMNVLRNQPELNRTGIFSSPEYFRFSQLLQSQNPMEYNKARPFSSGALPKTIFDLVTRPVTTIGGGIMDSLDTLGVINRTEKEKPDPLDFEDFLPQSLFANLPIDERVDSGGVNEVAQSIINNQAPVLPPEEDVVTINPEDMVIPGFGIEGPPNNIGPIPLGGGVTEILPGFSLNDTLRLLADRGIFSPTTVT